MTRGTSRARQLRAAAVQGGSDASGASPTPPATHRGESAESVHVRGASGDPTRGAYCTPQYVAHAVNVRGKFELDGGARG